MLTQIDAVFENGLLRPLKPLALAENERVRLTLARASDEEESDEEDDLIDHEYMAACAAEADFSITLEQVRAALSGIKGSLDDAIDQDRGEY